MHIFTQPSQQMASKHPKASARLNSVYLCNNVCNSTEELKASSYTKRDKPASLGFAAVHS